MQRQICYRINTCTIWSYAALNTYINFYPSIIQSLHTKINKEKTTTTKPTRLVLSKYVKYLIYVQRFEVVRFIELIFVNNFIFLNF